jgi:hypothetical protein
MANNSEECQGSQRAVVPMMMMMIYHRQNPLDRICVRFISTVLGRHPIFFTVTLADLTSLTQQLIEFHSKGMKFEPHMTADAQYLQRLTLRQTRHTLHNYSC